MTRIVGFLLLQLLIACNSDKNPYENDLNIDPRFLAEADTAHYTTLQWKDSVFDFGTIMSGDSVHAAYQFTNTGNTPLFIFNTRTTCGCTVTDFPKEPIFPGKQGVIHATFKSGNLKGDIQKGIIVIANTTGAKRIMLIIRGKVQPLK